MSSIDESASGAGRADKQQVGADAEGKETLKQFEALPFRPPRLRRGSARKADQERAGRPPALASEPAADDPAD